MNTAGNNGYLENVLAKLANPGLLLLVVGAVMVYISTIITGWFVKDHDSKQYEQANLICKAIGCVIALVGTLKTLNII